MSDSLKILNSNFVNKYAQIVWDYLQIKSSRRKADCIIVMTSKDLSVADRGTRYFFDDLAPFIVVTGGYGRLTPKEWKKPEAEMFSEYMVKLGMPREKMVIENKSTNTSENILLTKEMLKKKGIKIKSAIFVMTPTVERRAYAMFRKKWPELKIYPPYPKVEYEEYVGRVLPKKEVLNLLVGEIARLNVYGRKGYLVKQRIPSRVNLAFNILVKHSYTKYLVESFKPKVG